MPRDPVCGRNVTARGAAARLEYQGKMYYFCSDTCREEFTEDPEHFDEKRGPERRERTEGKRQAA